MPVAILDVDYHGVGATAACVVAERWTDGVPIETHVAQLARVEPYAPGRFFERELPCLVAVLPRVTVPLDAVVIDGYVFLDATGTPGLGAHLHAHLGGRVAVVGVAKTRYGAGDFATSVLRGRSSNPLFVTSVGLDVAEAARRVEGMHGPFRIPTLLTWVDRLAAGDPPGWPTG